MGTDRRHASAWFEWRSHGWLCSGLGFEYRTGSGSSTLSPDHCTALLRKSPQADIVRRTIITDDRRQRSSSGCPESRGQVRRGSEASRVHREGWMWSGTHEVRQAPWGGRTEVDHIPHKYSAPICTPPRPPGRFHPCSVPLYMHPAPHDDPGTQTSRIASVVH